MLRKIQSYLQGWSWLWLLLLIAFRLWFSVVLPMTGDEAYFVFWGAHPAGGYYDHPPMVGWWLTALLYFSHSEWFLRLPSTLLPLCLAWCAWWIVRPQSDERARYAALVVLLQPVNVWNVLVTTDTPLILFSMLSILAYFAALRHKHSLRAELVWHALAGIFLGLAFLSKYFAALLGISFLIHVVVFRRDCARFTGLSTLLIAAVPALLYNLWWNSHHGWVNIVFNFLNRNSNAGFSATNPVLYVVSLFYLATPWLIYEFWKQRRYIAEILAENREANVAWWLLCIPLMLFGLMSSWRSVGLHWLLSFMPILGILASVTLPLSALRKVVKWSAYFAALHMLLVVLIATQPIRMWQSSRLYDGIVLTVRAREVLERLEPYAKDYLFSAEGYSLAATMAYNSRRPFAVFGEGSFYARQDDFVTDWRAQNGRNVLILRKSPPNEINYSPFFDRLEFADFEMEGVRYYLVLGRGFNYPAYHDKILVRIRERFYRIPAWLPLYGCDFCDRYFQSSNRE